MSDFVNEHFTTLAVVWSLVLVLAGFIYGYTKAKRNIVGGRENLDGPPPLPLDPPKLSDEAKARIEDALRKNRRIEAVKIMREETGVNLTTAKAHIDRMSHRLGE